MEFKRDTFVTLEATTTVHLGRLQKNLRKGDQVEYDGYTLKFSGMTEIMPELRAGVKRGWLVVAEPNVNVDDALEALEAVAAEPAPPKKQMAVETIYEEERVVSEVAPTGAKAASETKKFPLVVESQDDDMISVASVESTSGATVSGASSAEIAGGSISESQGAEAVGQIRLKTAVSSKTVISDGSQASSEITKLDNLSREAVPSKSADSLQVEDMVEATLIPVEQEAPAVEEAPAVDEEALENAQILQAIEGEVQPTQGAVTVGKNDSKIAHLPCGIDWDMSAPWRKRAKVAFEKYGERPEVLEEIKAVESDGVISAIEKYEAR